MFLENTIRRRILMLIVAGGFFTLYSFLSITQPGVFNSPDEASNYFFSKQFSQTGTLRSKEAWNIFAPGLAHPRSTEILDNNLVPGGFIGLPVIFGTLARWLGLYTILFFGPALAVLAAILLMQIVKPLFGEAVSYVSGLLLLINPIWWYEASRPMFANVPFVTMVLAAVYFYLSRPLFKIRNLEPDAVRGFKNLLRDKADLILSGFFLALAAAIRPMDLLILVLVVAVGLFFRRKPNFKEVSLVLISAIMFCLPFLLINQQTYGKFFGWGYRKIEIDVIGGDKFGATVKNNIPTFLIRPRQAVKTFWNYGVKLNPLFFGLVVFGLLGFGLNFKRWQTDQDKQAWAVSLIVVGLTLLIFYGSFDIRDNPNPNLVSLGSSYLRYSLPIIILLIPLLAEGLIYWSARFKSQQKYFLWILIGVIGVTSFHFVFFSKFEGLLALNQTLKQYRLERQKILELTPTSSLLVIDRADKYIWPERSVLYPLRSDSTYLALPKLLKAGMIYYYGITLNDTDIAYLEKNKFSAKIVFKKIVSLNENSLYKFEYVTK